MHDLTFIILTYNEEKNISACLESIKGIPANVFVVDSYSDDKTLEILKESGVNYVQHTFENYSRQRNWAQVHDPYNSEWVFHLDADERLTPELKYWLINEFKSLIDADAYIFGRRAVFMGKWIKYGGHYPIYQLRLFRKALGGCEDKAYDQHFVCRGVSRLIKNRDIVNVLSDNLGSFINRHNTWSLLEAVEILRNEKSGEVSSKISGNPIERKRWLKNNLFEKSPLFIRSFLYFLYRYIFRLGFLDGKEGLIFHVLQGFWFRFLVDSKVYELRTEMKEKGLSLGEAVNKKYGIIYE